MQPLDRTLRNRLESTVKEARDTAENAARAALEQLGVGKAAPFAHLGESEKDLRRRLRVHGRQLGDSRDAKGEQEIDALVGEVAYEHWHRMLFARFLAENNLLMYPDPVNPVPVTLGECDDLAADEGAANGWELAARFAARMLPQVFRPDSPVFQLTFPPEHQQKLERLVSDLSPEVFKASDSLGWVYQFWQAKEKKAVNDSGGKIGARELPAVTQLFTEPYMVSFLLDNSLGAWWTSRRLSFGDLKNARSEEELRRKAATPGVPLSSLRFVKQEDETWTPAAGTFDAWPKQLAELKVLDPCCGSGHFLVAALLMLVPMRMEMEGLTAREAVNAVLRENIHGLELDKRCVELAAFALALAAWKFPGAGGYRVLPELNVACSGLSVSVAKEEWKRIGLGKRNLTIALEWMYDTFQNAPLLGSLLNPTKTESAKLVKWDDLAPALEEALRQEQPDEEREAAVVAQGLARAAMLLAGKYHLVTTNVPYLARGKQDEDLKAFCEKHHQAAKNDLATVFLDRCLDFCDEGGTASIVLPQNWLFLTSYRKFREKLLKSDTWHLIARLGPGAFETISGEVVKAILITLSRGNRAYEQGRFFKEEVKPNVIRGLDVSEPRTAAEKAGRLLEAEIKSVEQAKQLENPDAIVSLEKLTQKKLLSSIADYAHGMAPGDTAAFTRRFWELTLNHQKWMYMATTPDYENLNSGKCLKIMDPELILKSGCKGFRYDGRNAWGKKGIVIGKMRELPSAYYSGEIFDDNIHAIIPHDEKDLLPIRTYIEFGDFSDQVRRFNQKLAITSSAVVKIPFDLDYWRAVSGERYPHGLPKPYTDDPTQWIFHGHPCGSVIWDEKIKWTSHGPLRTDDTVLQVAVARLLGYRWPAELDPVMELADEQREWVKRCEALLPYADEDGIVCIPPVRGEASASDRLLNLLAAAYGESWSTEILSQLLKNSDHAGKTLDTWLRDKFFVQHCKLFQHRPFVWHIWDGLRDGFTALVNYHKLDTKLLETLTYTYLGDWITRQKQEIANRVDGAQERLAAAEGLKKRLELILEGEAPYDIFVRWKPLAKQPIGWAPDLNDGVRLNIRPFMTVPDVGKRGAGILRDKPNISWDKDRGKDVESAPWFHLFGGDRINDHHLTLAEKCAAKRASK